jgi:hypothetical protein
MLSVHGLRLEVSEATAATLARELEAFASGHAVLDLVIAWVAGGSNDPLDLSSARKLRVLARNCGGHGTHTYRRTRAGSIGCADA